MSTQLRPASGTNVAAGRYVIPVQSELRRSLHQIALSGAGTVTITMYPPGELDPSGAVDEAIVGELPVVDGEIALAGGAAPYWLIGFVSGIVLTGTDTFSYRIHSG